MAPQYQTVELLTDDVTPASKLFNLYPKLFNSSDYSVFKSVHALRLCQVDHERASELFRIIEVQLHDDKEKGLALMGDLITCGENAVRDVYNSNSSSVPPDTDDLFGRLHEFVRTELHFEPIPSKTSQVPTKETATRITAHARDTGNTGDKYSGSLCPFTGLPHAQMSHILPVKAAGATRGHRWFWLWSAIILPKHIFDAAWDACGGDRQHAPCNVLMLSYPLHRYFDSLNICFKPFTDKETASVAFQVQLQCAHPLSLHKLRRADDDALLENGSRLWWQPRSEITQEMAPSPLLLSLHRWIVLTRPVFTSMGLKDPPPSPLQPAANSDGNNSAWDRIAGRPRSTSSTPRSATSTPHRRQVSGDNTLSPLSSLSHQQGLQMPYLGGDGQLDYSDEEDERVSYTDDADDTELGDDEWEPEPDRAALLAEFLRVFLAGLHKTYDQRFK